MQFIKYNITILTLIITASLSLLMCSDNAGSDSGAPSRRTNAVIIGGTDTTGVPQAYAWFNGAAIPLGDGIYPSGVSEIGVSEKGALFVGYQNNGLIDKASFWHYENGNIKKYDIGGGGLSTFNSQANFCSRIDGDRYLYIAGNYNSPSSSALLWKIDLISATGAGIILTPGITYQPASANSVYNLGGPVVVAGYVTMSTVKLACYWLNPVNGTPNMTLLSAVDSEASMSWTWLSGSGVSTVGYDTDGSNRRACLWENTIRFWLGDAGFQSQAYKAFNEVASHSGTDTTVYFIGYQSNGTNDIAGYWIWNQATLSATWVPIGISTRDSRALDLWRFEGKVYVTGYEYSADGAAQGTKEACMWIDGAKTVLNPGRAGTGTGIWDPYFDLDDK